VIGHFFSFYANRSQPAPVDFDAQWFRLCFDNFPHTATFTLGAAPQIAIYGVSQQPAQYPPKNTNQKKGYETDGEQI
jgi:hypothetical protein